MANWVFDSARKAGDSAVVASDSNCYVVVFRSVGRQEYATKDVRHILFKVDESALDSEAETYEADLQAAKDAAKAAAEDAVVRLIIRVGHAFLNSKAGDTFFVKAIRRMFIT